MERVAYRRMHDLSRISAPKFHFKSRFRVKPLFIHSCEFFKLIHCVLPLAFFLRSASNLSSCLKIHFQVPA